MKFKLLATVVFTVVAGCGILAAVGIFLWLIYTALSLVLG